MRTGRGEYLHRTFGEETVGRHAATELVLIQVAGFLRRELPIRLAHRLQDLQGIPVLKDMPSVQAVCDLYAKSFLELEAFDSKIQTVEQEEAFAIAVEQIYERHSKVLVQMARGAFEFRQAVRANGGGQETQFELQEETHAFLDRFYLCRIGIRVLIGQYLALRQPPVENYVGIICSQTSPYEIVKRAIDDAAFMCTRKYGDAPEVIMSGSLDLTFPYVPTHLRKYCIVVVVCASQIASQSYCTAMPFASFTANNECLTICLLLLPLFILFSQITSCWNC
jgi:pyruvate dehydrogenase kinase 2/3/4